MVEIVKSTIRTLILLGLGTLVTYRELILKDTPNFITVVVGLSMIMGEGFVSAWILRKPTTEPPSERPSELQP
jgi:hypothetical protein